MQGIFQKENTDKALKYGIYRHLPTYEKIIRNLVSFYEKNEQIRPALYQRGRRQKQIIYHIPAVFADGTWHQQCFLCSAPAWTD